MNNCTLVIKVIGVSEYQYASNGNPVAHCIGAFYSPYSKPEETTPSIIKCIAWGERLATVVNRLENGQECIVTGRLNMNTIERPSGFKEKKAELVLERIYSLGKQIADPEIVF